MTIPLCYNISSYLGKDLTVSLHETFYEFPKISLIFDVLMTKRVPKSYQGQGVASLLGTIQHVVTVSH